MDYTGRRLRSLAAILVWRPYQDPVVCFSFRQDDTCSKLVEGTFPLCVQWSFSHMKTAMYEDPRRNLYVFKTLSRKVINFGNPSCAPLVPSEPCLKWSYAQGRYCQGSYSGMM